eukprot:GFYU01024500.1.p1 GENE.GFYU01024500.1~~GFYU01024500.1.p1  ORF type:complete len:626 (-),score=94.96 GFYU01024500.1:2-1879(-)
MSTFTAAVDVSLESDDDNASYGGPILPAPSQRKTSRRESKGNNLTKRKLAQGRWRDVYHLVTAMRYGTGANVEFGQSFRMMLESDILPFDEAKEKASGLLKSIWVRKRGEERLRQFLLNKIYPWLLPEMGDMAMYYATNQMTDDAVRDHSLVQRGNAAMMKPFLDFLRSLVYYRKKDAMIRLCFNLITKWPFHATGFYTVTNHWMDKILQLKKKRGLGADASEYLTVRNCELMLEQSLRNHPHLDELVSDLHRYGRKAYVYIEGIDAVTAEEYVVQRAQSVKNLPKVPYIPRADFLLWLLRQYVKMTESLGIDPWIPHPDELYFGETKLVGALFDRFVLHNRETGQHIMKKGRQNLVRTRKSRARSVRADTLPSGGISFTDDESVKDGADRSRRSTRKGSRRSRKGTKIETLSMKAEKAYQEIMSRGDKLPEVVSAGSAKAFSSRANSLRDSGSVLGQLSSRSSSRQSTRPGKSVVTILKEEEGVGSGGELSGVESDPSPSTGAGEDGDVDNDNNRADTPSLPLLRTRRLKDGTPLGLAQRSVHRFQVSLKQAMVSNTDFGRRESGKSVSCAAMFHELDTLKDFKQLSDPYSDMFRLPESVNMAGEQVADDKEVFTKMRGSFPMS